MSAQKLISYLFGAFFGKSIIVSIAKQSRSKKRDGFVAGAPRNDEILKTVNKHLISFPFVFISIFGFLLLGLNFPLQAKWIWTKETGFINPKKVQVGTPREIFEQGKKALEAGDYDRAANLFSDLAYYSRLDNQLREDATYLASEAYYREREYYKAYVILRNYLNQNPNTPHLDSIVKRLLDLGFELAAGARHEIWGLKWFTSKEEGKKLIRTLLQEYPYTQYSEHYKLQFANFLLEQEDLSGAEREYNEFLKWYPHSEMRDVVKLKLGTVLLKKYQGTSYDLRPLETAKERLSQLTQENSKGQTQGVNNMTDPSLPLQQLHDVYQEVKEKAAQKDWEVANFYRRTGETPAERYYLESLLRDYPHTSWAQKARQALRNIKTKK